MVWSGTRDIQPRFPFPEKILPDVGKVYQRYTVPHLVEEQLGHLVGRYPSAHFISGILKDLSVIIQWFEYETIKNIAFYRPSDVSGVWLVPLIHRCLDLIPTDPNYIDQSELTVLEALRHAIILFVQPIRRRFGINTGPPDLRIRKLKAVLQQPWSDWYGFEPLFRWIVVSAGMEAKSIEDQLWFAEILATHEPFQHTQIEEHAVALLSFIWKEDILCEPLARFMFQLAETKNASLRPSQESTFGFCAKR
jgi:hypothetical protein